jgi:hypothetical protein
VKFLQVLRLLIRVDSDLINEISDFRGSLVEIIVFLEGSEWFGVGLNGVVE